jgi:hypothetical protein
LPKHSTHKAVSKLVLGKSYPSVDKALDWPVRFLGPSHRKMFHSYSEAFVVGIFTEGLEGGTAACIHVFLDQVDNRSKGLLKCLIEGAR